MPLSAEAGSHGFQPYVLDISEVAEAEGRILVFVVMKRVGGLLLALPSGSLPEYLTELGDSAGEAELFGPSTDLELAAALFQEGSPLMDPVPLRDERVNVLLVDFTEEVVGGLIPVATAEDLSGCVSYDADVPDKVPLPEDLIAAASGWILGPGEPERLQFYSAEEAPEPERKRPGRKVPAGPGTPGGKQQRNPAPKKRPTVASLAEILENMGQALPAISKQLEELTARTERVEAFQQENPSRMSVLRQPLGGSALGGSVHTSSLGELAKSMPAPRSSLTPMKAPLFSQREAQDLQKDLEDAEESPDLTRAVLEQSRALTALVGHLASSSGDVLVDPSSTGFGVSVKGAQGRMRLQQELASHKGVFFQSVLQAMSRRMFPAQSAEVPMATLRDRGVTPTQYLERFGGFGKTRDLGFIAWQVGMILNHMQEDNFLAAKDATSLLLVCLEQSAMDGGKMDVGLLLALTEDPPQSLFTGRSLSSSSRARAFAPLADQRWITNALQYLKELDTITTKRGEFTSQKTTTSTTDSSTAPKRKGRKGAGGKGSQKVEEDPTE